MARVEKYGVEWTPVVVGGKIHVGWTEWMIERGMFMWGKEKGTMGAKFPRQYLGEAEHFRRMMSVVLGGGANPFEWNPNATRIVDEYFKNKFLAIAGHGSSSKTDTIAVIAIGEFFASPIDTGILVTSTTLAESRGRVWGRIEYYWQDACDFFGGEKNAPGELVSSSGIIRYRVGNRKDDTKGIKLVPGRESEVKEGIGRMKGFKARRMRLMGDEFSDLSHKLLEAAESNLFLNEDFKMAVAFNPNSHFDPAGVISEPEQGWGSIDVLNSDGWKTKRGYCIRFDGEKSPNVVLNEKRWKGLLTADKLEDRRKELGDNSPRFIEQYRGAWSETGNADAIYTEAEIIKYLGMQKVEVWQDQPKLCAGFDPSHTHGGDRAVLVVAKAGVGLSLEKFSPMIEFLETVYLDENIDTTKDKNELIIERLKSEMQSRSIDPRFLAMDATGGGNPLATLMARDPFFSNHFLKVQFGGSASELVSQGVKGKDRYANMASELWYAGKPMLRSGQVRGLRPEMVREMTLRLYEETGGNTPKIRIESKEDMKKRLGGRSPDVSDSMFLCLFAARARLGLASAEKTAKPEKKPEGPLDHLFKWGLRKKPEFEKPDYVLKGGGWGDEGIDLDAVVMGRR